MMSSKHRVFINPRIVSPNLTLCEELALLGEDDCEKHLSGLCGFPSFCSEKAYETCLETPLKDCAKCSVPQVGILLSVYVILGILSIFGNGLVLRNVLTKQKGFEDMFSKIRASLAVADLLTGFQIFVVIIYNLSWTLDMSSLELDTYQEESKGTAKANVGGIIYLLGFTSSMYHLVYLTLQRLYAIAFPFRYKFKTNNSTYIGLAVVWVFAILSAIFPVWFPGKLAFSYHPNIFLYFPTKITTNTAPNYQAAIAVLIVFLIAPYLLMTCLSVISGALLFIYHKKRFQRLTASHPLPHLQKNRMTAHEYKVFKTIGFMQVGFIVTMLPLVVVCSLYYAEKLKCDVISTPYLVSFILSMWHSLMNVITYSILDQKFRNSLFGIFPQFRRKKKTSPKISKKTGGGNNNSSSEKHTPSAHNTLKRASEAENRSVLSMELSAATATTDVTPSEVLSTDINCSDATSLKSTSANTTSV